MLHIMWVPSKLQNIKLESWKGKLKLERLKDANLFLRLEMEDTTAVPFIFPVMG